ncbi:MAG: trypsin-like serine protease [Myxococcales bacterium]
MKKKWGLGAVATLTCGLGLLQFACSGSPQSSTPAEPAADPKLEELIGSVPVNSASLDGIGSIGIVYDYGYGGSSSAGAPGAGFGNAPAAGAPASAGGADPFPGGGAGGTYPYPYPSPFYPQCTGTLVSKNSVLTSRSCGQLLQQTYYSGSVKFAIGANSAQPKRLVDVVDVEFAPADTSNGGFSYPDIAVLHLGESVTDVAPFPVALLTDDLIGKQLAAVGFGNSDLRYQSGTRRAGSLTLRATSGLLFPAIFGSFDAFYQYEISGGNYPYPYPPYNTGGAFGVAEVAVGAGAPAVAGAGPMAGGGGASGGAGGASGSSGAGGSNDDWYRQYLQQQYDSVALATGESYLGGTDADAQPCGADQGGPIVRKLQNKVRVFGVFSRTPFGGCDKGGIYASITAATKTFIDAAAQWKDPCTGITTTGSCVGTTATRCSTPFEGKRKAVKLDCSLLNQVCVGGGTTEVACTDK